MDKKEIGDYLVRGDEYMMDNPPENWDKAYACYTDESASAIQGKRKIAIIQIVNHGKYNKRVILLSIAFLLFSIAFIVLTSRITVFHTHIIWKIACILLQIIEVVRAIVWNKKNPYSSLQVILPLLFAIWAVYVVIWLI